MKKLSTKWFSKWSKKVNLSDHDLLDTIDNLEEGLSSASLGGNLYKVRVKREHSGKSSGFRTIVVYQIDDKAIFIYGFGKSEKDNISKAELKHFKILGRDLLALNSEQLEQLIEKKSIFDLEVVK